MITLYFFDALWTEVKSSSSSGISVMITRCFLLGETILFTIRGELLSISAASINYSETLLISARL
jgi:hypothetical protein